MLRFGFIADGCFKLLVGIVYCVFLSFFGSLFPAPTWLVVTSAIFVFLSGAAEISYAAATPAKTHTKYLIAYDSVWVLATIIALVLMFNDVGGAGFVWFGVQALGSILMAVVFTRREQNPATVDLPED